MTQRTARDLARLIPAALLALDLWNTWSMSRTKGGKPTKKPDGSVSDPAYRFPFLSLADTVIDKHHGVGFVFTGGVFSKGHRLVSFDVDAARDPQTGMLSPWAQSIVDHYNTWTEITPSGTGLRVWLWVKNPPHSLPMVYVPQPAPSGVDKKPQVQTFGLGAAQYVTMTGDAATKVRVIKRVDNLDWFIEEFDIDLTPKPEATTEKFGISVERATELVMQIEDYDDRDVWLKVGMGLHNEFDEEGFDIWDEWAQQSASHDPDDSRRVWESFGRGGITFATVQKLATDGGANPLNADAFRDGWNANEWKPPEKPKLGLRVLQAADFDAQCGTTEFLIYNLIPARGLLQFFGEPSCGKTPYALSLALHVALGKDWFGHELERPGATVYMVGEDMTGVRDRMIGQLKTMKSAMQLADLPFYLTTEPGALIDHEDVKRWVSDIKTIVAQRSDQVRLLVIDTQNRNFGPGNENSSEDMTKFVDGCDLLRRELDCCVLLVHHVGLTETDRARGSSVQKGSWDVTFEVQKVGMQVQMLPHKHKNWAKPNPLRGTLVPVVVAQDPKGRDISAITLSDKVQTTTFIDMTDEQLKLIVGCIQLTDGDPISQQQLAAASNQTRKQLRISLKQLTDAGMIKVTSGKGGSKSSYSITEFGVASFFPELDAKQAELDDLLS